MLLSLRSNSQTMSPYIHKSDSLCTSTDHHLITTYCSTYGSVGGLGGLLGTSRVVSGLETKGR